MKKMFLIFAVIVVLFGSKHSYRKQFSFNDYFTGEYCCYTSTPTDDDCIFTGSCYINKNKTNKNVVGESITIYNFEPAAAIKLLNAKIVKTELLSTGATVIYAYTEKIGTHVNLFNTQVNLQIAIYDDHSVLGWPLILGSF